LAEITRLSRINTQTDRQTDTRLTASFPRRPR